MTLTPPTIVFKRRRKQRSDAGKPRKPRDPAALATPRKVMLTHGGHRKEIMNRPLDGRTKTARLEIERTQALIEHMGSNVTDPQKDLACQAARISLAVDIAWLEFARASSVLNAEGSAIHPALETFLRAARDHRAVLETIGLRRPVKTLSLNDVLNKGKRDDDAS